MEIRQDVGGHQDLGLAALEVPHHFLAGMHKMEMGFFEFRV